MKKKKFIILFVVAVAVKLGYGGMKAYKNAGNNNLMLANVEALTQGDFNGKFNGQDWNSDKQFYNILGSNWCPVLLCCTYTDPTFNLNLVIIELQGATCSYPGHYISCHNGTGNCFNGTICIKD